MTQLIAHLIALDDWFALDPCAPYRPTSLQHEGFIHFSMPSQVARSANLHFHSHTSLILVWFDTAALKQSLIMEATTTTTPFPHVYAPLHLSDAVRIELFERLADAAFTYPPDGVVQGSIR
jgi:uncharacterized protein (DUF952 family)